MDKSLQELRETLIAGQRLAKQGSYERRAPAKKAVPFLLESRAGLREYVRNHEQDADGWRLLSQAEECLLSYGAARTSLERAISLRETPDKKDLKRLVLLKEYESKWARLSLTPKQLAQLGRHLEKRLAESPCDHTLRHTETWLQAEAAKGVRETLEAIRSRGGYCDCEALANVVRG
jgi:hypothetical protein